MDKTLEISEPWTVKKKKKKKTWEPETFFFFTPAAATEHKHSQDMSHIQLERHDYSENSADCLIAVVLREWTVYLWFVRKSCWEENRKKKIKKTSGEKRREKVKTQTES